MVAIFVLSMFLFLLSVDLIVLKIQGKNHPAFEPSFSQYDLLNIDRDSFAIPSDILLSKGHTWLKNNKDGFIHIGIDEFAAEALGSLSILNFPPIGKELKRGDTLFEGSYGDKIVKFKSPINGIVKSVNTDIIGQKISNPYETWGVRLSSKNFAEDQRMFFQGSEAISWMKKESLKLKNFINAHTPKVELAGATMFDGGQRTNSMISLLVDQSVNDFEKEFLSL
ncbi:MAG TPA: hypothetical protein PKD67_09600 [Ignavibacteriaceae bacterium]|nr:hypothetical protein [Ignavibacteriaceae bacterium]